MSGNEYRPTRPEASQQENIVAGSGLAVLGIVLEILRERFMPGNGLSIAWDPDASKTEILIEIGYSAETEKRNAARALYVTRLNAVPTKVAVGNRAGVRLPDHYEGFFAFMSSSITIDCVSNDMGDSMILADIVQGFLVACKAIIEQEYGIHDMSLADTGQTAPFTHDQDKWSTPVSFVVQYAARWTHVKIRPLLASVGLRLESGATLAGFEEAASASMSRSIVEIE